MKNSFIQHKLCLQIIDTPAHLPLYISIGNASSAYNKIEQINAATLSAHIPGLAQFAGWSRLPDNSLFL